MNTTPVFACAAAARMRARTRMTDRFMCCLRGGSTLQRRCRTYFQRVTMNEGSLLIRNEGGWRVKDDVEGAKLILGNRRSSYNPSRERADTRREQQRLAHDGRSTRRRLARFLARGCRASRSINER